MLHDHRLSSEATCNEHGAQKIFARAKAFYDWKISRSQILSGFFDFQKKSDSCFLISKKAKSYEKRQNLKLWLQKRQIGNPVLWLTPNMVHWFARKRVKRNVSWTVKWREQQQNNFVVKFWNFAKHKHFRLIGEQSAAASNDIIAKNIVCGLFQNLSGRPEDWTVSGAYHL